MAERDAAQAAGLHGPALSHGHCLSPGGLPLTRRALYWHSHPGEMPRQDVDLNLQSVLAGTCCLCPCQAECLYTGEAGRGQNGLNAKGHEGRTYLVELVKAERDARHDDSQGTVIPPSGTHGAYGWREGVSGEGVHGSFPGRGRAKGSVFSFQRTGDSPAGDSVMPGTRGLRLPPFPALRTICPGCTCCGACRELRPGGEAGAEASRRPRDGAARKARRIREAAMRT